MYRLHIDTARVRAQMFLFWCVDDAAFNLKRAHIKRELRHLSGALMDWRLSLVC